jgi:hypothetical protein
MGADDPPSQHRSRPLDAADEEHFRAMLDPILPAVLTMVGRWPPSARPQAVVVVADTRHEPAAELTRAVFRAIPSGAARIAEIGTSVQLYSQPQKTMESLFRAHDVPVPPEWARVPLPGAVRIAMLLGGRLVSVDFMVPALVEGVGSA